MASILLLWFNSLVSFWPMVLPLFLLRGCRNRFRSYLLLVVVAFGVLGLVSFPLVLYLNLGPIVGSFPSTNFILFSKYAQQPLALILYLLIYRKYRISIREF